MTERERVYAIFNHEQPDQLPWFADFAYYKFGLEQMGKFPKQYEDTYLDSGLQKMHRDYGTGFYLQGFEPVRKKGNGWEIASEKKGNVTTTIITTPVGKLTQVEQFSRISFSNGITKHYIEDIDDMKIYLWMMQHTDFSSDYEYAQARYETIGDNGIVLCYTPKSPVMDMIALLAGVENVSYIQADDGEEFAAILDELEEIYDKACRIVVDSPAECIMIPENITSECAAPFYERHMKRYHQKWTDAIREAGKHSFVHQDGTVRGLISRLSRESHFDVIEAVTPMPVGDVEIDEVAGLVDDSTIIWGGIPGGMFSEAGCTDEEFEAHVKHVIEVMTSAPRYVLGVADQVVPGSSEKRIRMVRKLVDQYGKY